MRSVDRSMADASTYGSTTERYGSDASTLRLDACEDDDRATSSSGGGSRSRAGAHYIDRICPQCMRCGCPCIAKRYLTAVMCCFGFVILFGFRCNVGTATGYFRNLYNASALRNVTGTELLSLQWSASVVGTVESAYFWGFLITQIPGGIIANRLPATRVFSTVTLVSSVINLLLPVALNTSIGLAIVLRVMQDMLEGCTYPACHGIWRYWAPPLDRSRLVTIAFSGSYSGAFLGLLLSGVVSETLGWPAPFYFFGAAGVLWFVAWQFCVFDTPAVHPCITPEERAHIEDSMGKSVHMNTHDNIADIPWAKMLTSMPFYAIIVANTARNWTVNLLIIEPTKYLSDVFKYDVSHSGFYSSLPHLIMSIVVPVSGQVADELRKRLLSTTAVRKLFNCIGFGMEAAFLLGVGYTANANTAIVCLTVAVSFSGLAVSGFNVNHLDIAPRYASILMGISNAVGTLASLLVPVVTLQLVKDHKQQSWSKVFLLASLIHSVGVVFYAIFASGEQQEWAEPPTGEEKPWTPPSPDEERKLTTCSSGVMHLDSQLFSAAPTFVQKENVP